MNWLDVQNSVFGHKEAGFIYKPSKPKAFCTVSNVYIVIPGAAFHRARTLTHEDEILLSFRDLDENMKLTFMGKYQIPDFKYRGRKNKSIHDPPACVADVQIDESKPRVDSNFDVDNYDYIHDSNSGFPEWKYKEPSTLLSRNEAYIWRTNFSQPHVLLKSDWITASYYCRKTKAYKHIWQTGLYDDADVYPLEWNRSFKSFEVSGYCTDTVHIQCPIVDFLDPKDDF